MNRVELSINSKYSGNSLVEIEELVSVASKLGLDGIAITDFNDVNSFFELERVRKNDGNLEIIYGTKIKVNYKELRIKVDILVRNKQGLKNLYKILTSLNTQTGDIDIYQLFDDSDGLLIGLNLMNDNVYELLKKQNKEDIYEFIKVFDYLIINPSENHDYIIKMVDVAREYHKMIVSSSDVRYLKKEDKKYYEILKGSNVSGDHYLMSTQEMLDEFHYLNEIDKKRIVIENPHKINSLIDKNIPLLKEIKYYKKEKNKLKEKVYKKANELYQNKIPKDIETRIENELSLISEINAYNILINSILVRMSEEMGYVTFTRGAAASSYINYLLGITKVNPLQYDLDYREFYGDNREKILRICINYDERVVKYLLDYIRNEFGETNVIRCGTMGYMGNTLIKEKIKRYEENNRIQFNASEIELIMDKLAKVKRMNGILPGTYFCLPDYFCLPACLDSSDFSPLIKLNDFTTMIDYHKLQENLLKITILETSYNRLYDDLMKRIKTSHIDLTDSKVWNVITDSNNVVIYQDQHFKDEIEKVKPTNIKELAVAWQNVHQVARMAQAIEYALIHYQLFYIAYYYKDIYDEVVKKYDNM